MDGAITVPAVQSFIQSVQHRVTSPTIVIAGVPQDRDYAGVYAQLAPIADRLILTETDIHPNIHFPSAKEALTLAKQLHHDVHYRAKLPQAVDLAFATASEDGTILLAVAQPLVGEAIQIWGVDVSVI